MKISIVVAMDEKRGIGKDNKLLWNIPEDLKRFKQITSGHPIIMGRKTYESIGRPLPNRTNIVITHSASFARRGLAKLNGVVVVHSLVEAIKVARHHCHPELARPERGPAPYGAGRGRRVSGSTKCIICNSLEEAIEIGKKEEILNQVQHDNEKEVFVIGGGQIFAQALSLVNRLYLTIVKGDFGADTFFPDYSEFEKILSKQEGESNGYRYTFIDLEK